MIGIFDAKEYYERIISTELKDVEKTTKYRLSVVYFLRTLILVTCLILFIVFVVKPEFTGFSLKSIISYILELFLVAYIVYTLMYIFRYKIVVSKEQIINGRLKINVKDINKLEVRLFKVAKGTPERVLCIITNEGREYVFRLNIVSKFRFIKQVMDLSGAQLEVKE